MSKPHTCKGCIITVKYIVLRTHTNTIFSEGMHPLSFAQLPSECIVHHHPPPKTTTYTTKEKSKNLKSQNPSIPSVVLGDSLIIF